MSSEVMAPDIETGLRGRCGGDGRQRHEVRGLNIKCGPSVGSLCHIEAQRITDASGNDQGRVGGAGGGGRLLNLFNAKTNQIEYYYLSRLPGEPIDGIADRHVHPAEPLAVRLSLAARF
jgi:hypothetical protein